MDINDVLKKEDLTAIVISELKAIGIKYQKGKKNKPLQGKRCRKHIFRTHMHLLELTDVILASGKVVQIPKFVADACNCILEQVETEGLFRKAGSFARQKEIRLNLEAGIELGKTHHVIDVANVVKYFFRELPEPLIPPNIQETFLQSFLKGENHINAILLSCLLLPTLTINTLSFFMQFLYTVSLNQSYNKMSVENLAIIFTPGIMPYLNINSSRFSNHVKIISVLIKNSSGIGVIPHNIKRKIGQSSTLSVAEPSAIVDPLLEFELKNSIQNEIKEYSTKKKKKRRSDVFNGLKRIVGTAMGSSEFLDHTQTEKDIMGHQKANDHNTPENNTTPFNKDIKKRKIGDALSVISTKKKKDIIGLLPTSSSSFLPNSPLAKNSKKSRLSFGGNRHTKQTSSNPVVISMERRWSIVGSGWSKNKKKYNNNCGNDKKLREIQNNEGTDQVHDTSASEFSSNFTKTAEICSHLENNDICIQISKNEYEEIKERVAAIEAHISSELAVFENTVIADKLSGPEKVQTQYERIIVETEALSSPATEHLAQRLNRSLKIRQSIDHCVIRSPSARKIGKIRRRSVDKGRLPKNSSTCNVRSTNIVRKESRPHFAKEDVSSQISLKSFNPKSKVSPFKSTKECYLSPSHNRKILNFNSELTSINDDSNEQWMPGVDFFNSVKTKQLFYKENQYSFNQTHVEHVATPDSRKNNSDFHKTPIVVSRSCTKKTFTPLNIMSTAGKLSYINRTEEISGRASIARLRTQNAGMVMAKAKLFDGLEYDSKEIQLPKNNKNNISEVSNKSSIEKRQTKFFSDENILLIEPNINILQSKLESTPIAKRIQNISFNGPVCSPKRKQCSKTAKKYTQKQIITNVITDGKIVKNKNLNECPFNSNKEINLNLNRKMFTNCARNGGKSPRVFKTNRQNSKLRNTPLGGHKQN